MTTFLQLGVYRIKTYIRQQLAVATLSLTPVDDLQTTNRSN